MVDGGVGPSVRCALAEVLGLRSGDAEVMRGALEAREGVGWIGAEDFGEAFADSIGE